MKNSIPKRTENIILEAEKSILKEDKDKKKNKTNNKKFSIDEVFEATKNLYPDIWKKKND
tara:strand:- start:1096 stop:1275 length:180 start_codon:yes stop_codon:yes gene_type:complete